MRVLLVEDEVRLADNLAAALRDGPGFAVDWAEDGQAGDLCAQNLCYDLIVLDLMLPKMDGLNVVAEMREHGNTMPVLFLSALSEVDDRVKASRPAATTISPSPMPLSSSWLASMP